MDKTSKIMEGIVNGDKQLKWVNGINYTPEISNYLQYAEVLNVSGRCHYAYFIKALKTGFFILSTVEYTTLTFERVWQSHNTLEDAKAAANIHYLEQIAKSKDNNSNN